MGRIFFSLLLLLCSCRAGAQEEGISMLYGIFGDWFLVSSCDSAEKIFEREAQVSDYSITSYGHDGDFYVFNYSRDQEFCKSFNSDTCHFMKVILDPARPNPYHFPKFIDEASFEYKRRWKARRFHKSIRSAFGLSPGESGYNVPVYLQVDPLSYDNLYRMYYFSVVYYKKRWNRYEVSVSFMPE